LFVAALSSATAETKQLVFLHSYGRHFSPYEVYASKLRAKLAQESSEPIDIYEVDLSTTRSVEGEQEDLFVEFLNSLFAGRQPDLVITIGGPAADFLQRNRQRVFSSTPVLFSAVEQRRLNNTALTAYDAAAKNRIDLPLLVANILSLLPHTTHIAVVGGNSPLEKFWLQEMRREFRQFTDRIEFSWFNELSFNEILRRVATLPPQSAILLGILSVGATGVTPEEDTALAAIHTAANAPIFGYLDAEFGQGIVSGPLISIEELSRQAASVAIRILRGETPGDIKVSPVGFARPELDWRELRRWDIDEASLPIDSIVQFREPTVWERYKWYIGFAVALFTLEAILILALLVNGRNLRRADAERRRAEDEAHDLSGRLINAHEEERSRLARELHDDVTQRLALLAIDAGHGERSLSSPAGGAAMRTMREGLVRLSEDVHALSYRLHPSILEDLGLVEALESECERFSRTYSSVLDTNADDIPERLPRRGALSVSYRPRGAAQHSARAMPERSG
jgi:signal transduction histidine kinase